MHAGVCERSGTLRIATTGRVAQRCGCGLFPGLPGPVACGKVFSDRST